MLVKYEFRNTYLIRKEKRTNFPYANQWDFTPIDWDDREVVENNIDQCRLCGDITWKQNFRTLKRCKHSVCLHCMDRIESGWCCDCWTTHPTYVREEAKYLRMRNKQRRKKRKIKFKDYVTGRGRARKVTV